MPGRSLRSVAEFENGGVRARAVQEVHCPERETAKANGTRFGTPRKVDEAEHIATARRMKEDGHACNAIAKYLGLSRAALYRYLADF